MQIANTTMSSRAGTPGAGHLQHHRPGRARGLSTTFFESRVDNKGENCHLQPPAFYSVQMAITAVTTRLRSLAATPLALSLQEPCLQVQCDQLTHTQPSGAD